MALFEIATFDSFAKLLLAARKLAEDGDALNRLKALADLAENGGKLRAAVGDRNLSPLAERIEAECENADAAFAHEPLIEEARMVFRDAAPVALARCDAFARNDLEQAVILQDMVEAVDGSDHASAFRETAMPEAYFRAVMGAALMAMLADTDFIYSLSPQLWRESLERQGVTIELLGEVREEQRQEASRAEARHRELLSHLRASEEATRLAEAGVTEDALIALAARIADKVEDLGQAWAELQSAIEVAIRVQEEGRHGSNLGDFVDEVLRRVADLSARGDHEDAAAAIDVALAETEAEHKARTLRLLEAGLEQDRLRRNAVAAARRVVRMAEAEAGDALDFEAFRALQDGWQVRGRDKGLLFDQEVSIELARIELVRAADADERGTAMNDLGTCLGELGEREAATARLEEALAAHRAALEEMTRERVPLKWATTQMNLGNTLQALGEREAGTARLEEAVAAYRDALEERTRERVPLGWAATQMNLGNVLATLGAREAGTGRLDEAVTAYRAALEERTRERVPLDWAMTQMNLGSAQLAMGEREVGTARLEEAAAAYRVALQERTRARVPLDWAMTQGNLANVEIAIFDKTREAARLDAAEAHVRAAQEVFQEAGAGQYLEMADRQHAEIERRRA